MWLTNVCAIETEYFSCIKRAAIEEKSEYAFRTNKQLQKFAYTLNELIRLYSHHSVSSSSGGSSLSFSLCSRHTSHELDMDTHSNGRIFENTNIIQCKYLVMLLLTVARIIVLVTIVIFGVFFTSLENQILFTNIFSFCFASSYIRSDAVSSAAAAAALAMHEFRSNINSCLPYEHDQS